MNETAKPKKTMANPRLAEAGRKLLEKPATPISKALIEAGYSPATARNANHNGIGAKRCIAEAVKADPSLDTGKIVEASRSALLSRLQDPRVIAKARLGELARVTDVVERWFGESRESGSSSRAVEFVDRALMIAEVLQELERRKIKAPS